MISMENMSPYERTIAARIKDFTFDLKYEDDTDGMLTQESMDRLKNFVHANSTSMFSTEEAHSNDHVGERTDADILNSVCDPDNKRRIDGQFANERAQWTAVADVLSKGAYSVARFKGRLDNGGANNMRLSFQTPHVLDDAAKSTGFIEINGFYHKFETTNCATVILKNDRATSDKDIGFTLQSAYPGWAYIPEKALSYIKDKEVPVNDIDKSINAGYMQRYGRRKKFELNNGDEFDMTRLSPETFAAYGTKTGDLTIFNDSNASTMKKTDMYKNATPLERSRLLLKADPRNAYDGGEYDPDKTPTVRVSSMKPPKEPGDETCYVITKITDMENQQEYRAFVSENAISIKKYHDGKAVGEKLYYPPLKEADMNRFRQFMKNEPRFSQMIKQTYNNIHGTPSGGAERGHEFDNITNNMNKQRELLLI